MKAELESLKQQLNKLKEENSKEEDDLKRKRISTEDFLRDNIKNYDHLMEEYAKEKADLDVSLGVYENFS